MRNTEGEEENKGRARTRRTDWERERHPCAKEGENRDAGGREGEWERVRNERGVERQRIRNKGNALETGGHAG